MKLFVLTSVTQSLQRKSSSEFRIEDRIDVVGVFSSVEKAQTWLKEHTVEWADITLRPVSYGVLGDWYQTQQIINKGSSLIDNKGSQFFLKEYLLNDKEKICTKQS